MAVMIRPRQAATAREACRLIAAKEPEVLLIVPGWFSSPELRSPVLKRVAWHSLTSRSGPVHARWLWLRDDGAGNTETAFLIWPCTLIHAPGLQCRDGQVAHGNKPVLPPELAVTYSRSSPATTDPVPGLPGRDAGMPARREVTAGLYDEPVSVSQYLRNLGVKGLR
jgi:hypothetical protein